MHHSTVLARRHDLLVRFSSLARVGFSSFESVLTPRPLVLPKALAAHGRPPALDRAERHAARLAAPRARPLVHPRAAPVGGVSRLPRVEPPLSRRRRAPSRGAAAASRGVPVSSSRTRRRPRQRLGDRKKSRPPRGAGGTRRPRRRVTRGPTRGRPGAFAARPPPPPPRLLLRRRRLPRRRLRRGDPTLVGATRPSGRRARGARRRPTAPSPRPRRTCGREARPGGRGPPSPSRRQSRRSPPPARLGAPPRDASSVVSREVASRA